MTRRSASTTKLTVALVCLATTGFAQSATASAPASAEDLIKQVLTALEMKDQAALEKLTITEGEYKKYIWTGLSGNSPGATEQKYYGLYQKGSALAIASALNDFGGRKLQFVRLSFGAPIKQTKGFRLLSAPSVTVRDDSGQEKTVRLVGAILEHDGTCKVATYAVTPTQQANR